MLFTDGDRPCWYELSYLQESGDLKLSIHQKCLEAYDYLAKRFSEDDYIEPLAAIADLWPLGRDLCRWKRDWREGIGFGGVFPYMGERDEFEQFRIPIPQVSWPTGLTCRECRGRGQRFLPEEGFCDELCWHCHGSGVKHISWKGPLWRTIVSLVRLFEVLNYVEIVERPNSGLLPQLFTVDTVASIGYDGASICGDLSPALTQYLSLLCPEDRQETTLAAPCLAMIGTYGRLFSSRDPIMGSRTVFTARVGKQHFRLECPGDACGIGTDEPFKEGESAKFACHNTDAPEQQITLLAGLAALHDKARKEMLRL